MPDIYLLIEGQQEGPYSEDQVRQSLAEGLIPADLPAWQEGFTEWARVESLVASVEGTSTELTDVAPASQLADASDFESPMLAPVPISRRRNTAWIWILICAFGVMAAVAAVVIGVIVPAKSLRHSASSTMEQTAVGQITNAADNVSTSVQTDSTAQTAAVDGDKASDSTTGNQATNPADNEKARVFIEKQFNKNYVYKSDSKPASVRIDIATGHLVIENACGYDVIDCFLGSLDADYVVEKSYSNTPYLIIPARESKRIIKSKLRDHVMTKNKSSSFWCPRKTEWLTHFDS